MWSVSRSRAACEWLELVGLGLGLGLGVEWGGSGRMLTFRHEWVKDSYYRQPPSLPGPAHTPRPAPPARFGAKSLRAGYIKGSGVASSDLVVVEAAEQQSACVARGGRKERDRLWVYYKAADSKGFVWLLLCRVRRPFYSPTLDVCLEEDPPRDHWSPPGVVSSFKSSSWAGTLLYTCWLGLWIDHDYFYTIRILINRWSCPFHPDQWSIMLVLCWFSTDLCWIMTI